MSQRDYVKQSPVWQCYIWVYVAGICSGRVEEKSECLQCSEHGIAPCVWGSTSAVLISPSHYPLGSLTTSTQPLNVNKSYMAKSEVILFSNDCEWVFLRPFIAVSKITYLCEGAFGMFEFPAQMTHVISLEKSVFWLVFHQLCHVGNVYLSSSYQMMSVVIWTTWHN